MTFKQAQRIATLLAKPFAESILTLLVSYKDISASETATRLELHIKTAQDFLEELTNLGVCTREQVYEKKRPYYRYKLKQYRLSMDVDLSELAEADSAADRQMQIKIRERKNVDAVFTVGRGGNFISSITLFSGEGRRKKERKLSLTQAQGKFLYFLPFPTAPALEIMEIFEQANIEPDRRLEIVDLVDLLLEHGVIEQME